MIDGYFAYSFTLGLAATVNPCGFVLLPTYLMYYLGLEGNRPGTQRASLQRALLVSGAVSLGAVAVFVIVGAISHAFTSVIENNVKYAGFAIGLALIVLGCFLLAGWKPRFALPQVNAGAERRQTFVSMLGFGVTYAVAS
ncbi:MAG TPA: cytochrome c biogenesis protein CcdA, partial [Ilumatobacteraceae bacterium]|nr:cytochrome c biogenesis protein CcdA [Ilumatobacteraceae bacterium]